MDLRDVELRIAVAEGVLSRSEADALGEEARRSHQDPLALLAERGRITQDSLQSFRAEALNAPELRAAGLDGEASTFTLDPPAARSSSEPAFPVPGWDRYTSVRFLGQGGMGMVFLALDTQLRREVAIKFVRGDDAEHVRRLITEARTQARVKHDRICNVYEVGEVEGKVYIAMQYIDGEPLGRLSGDLTVEQKVMLIRGAAEGIHEAHRVGIIHRDIKPSNIMVEQEDDGELRPYVMDFGLARSAQDANATMSGALLGTPRYMAPEQAQGDMAKLDRRADVYSLGATLYHLLTGQPPVAGEAVAEILHHLMIHDPPPPRTIDRSIPVDLEAIVVKCLERERSARYDSARALADDLGRFMNGEPVLARRAGHWYRLRKRLAKHRGLVTAGAAALAMIAIAVGWGIKTSGEADERERLARRFTEKVESMKSLARLSALSPRHDVRADRKEILGMMSDLAVEIREAGDVAAGAGYYALGRGYLALDDDPSARAELESAWKLGPHEPRVAYALAIVMGHLYRDNLFAAERIEDRETRDAKKLEIERQYRDPALAYLRESHAAELPSSEVPSVAYVDALMAYYGGHFDEALDHLDHIGGERAWSYEALELRGDILLARALQARSRSDSDRARSDFEAGRKAYTAAAEIGRSVPEIYTSLGSLEYAAMTAELYGHGDVTAPGDRALAAADNALATDTTNYDALVLRARVRRNLAEDHANRGEKIDQLLSRALDDVERAVASRPDRSQARSEMAAIYRQLGQAQVDRGQDPGKAFRKVVITSDAIPPGDRDASYFGNLGTTFSVWADYESEHGGDPDAHREQAIGAFGQALHLNQNMYSVWTNLGIDSYQRASRANAKHPDDDLTRSLESLEHAHTLHPNRWASYFYKGKVYVLRAERTMARGGDPDPDLQKALEANLAGLQINPRVAQLQNGLGLTLLDQARAAWHRGARPDALLDRADTAFRQAIDLAPEQSYGHGNRGEAAVQRAWFQRARGDDAIASAKAAVAELETATALVDRDPGFWADLALAHAILAEDQLDHGHVPGDDLAKGDTAIANALARDPKSLQAHRYRGELRGISARVAARSGRDGSPDLVKTEEALRDLITADPSDVDTRIVLGRLYRTWAQIQRDAGADPTRVLGLGLAQADQVLHARPSSPDGLALRDGLLALRAPAPAIHDSSAKPQSGIRHVGP